MQSILERDVKSMKIKIGGGQMVRLFLLLVLFLSLISCVDLGDKRSKKLPKEPAGGGNDPDTAIDEVNWFQKSPSDKARVFGASVDVAYDKLEIKKPSYDVVVAVLSDGLDLSHPNLAGKIWANTKEIAGNGIDDDANGYVDDINGWNYLGSAVNGVSVKCDSLEIARIYKRDCRDANNQDKNSVECKNLKDELASARDDAGSYYLKLKVVYEAYEKYRLMLAAVGLNDVSKVALAKIKLGDAGVTQEVIDARDSLLDLYSVNSEIDFVIIENIVAASKCASAHFYNPDSDLRKGVIGDDSKVGYGNKDLRGNEFDGYIGTHSASVVAGVRKNTGAKGIAENVKIMPLKVATFGDPRDIDIVNAINYAVNSGADIVLFGFEKEFSMESDLVDNAIKNANSGGREVLFIVPAGDRSLALTYKKVDVDGIPVAKGSDSFPRCNSDVSNCIKIGASSRTNKTSNLVYKKSNYSEELVHLFAPGEQIIGAIPEKREIYFSGTISAAAVTAGVVSLARTQNRSIDVDDLLAKLFQTVYTLGDGELVIIPGQDSTKVISMPFDNFSISGGLINAHGFVKALK